jgi:hypothetical protein
MVNDISLNIKYYYQSYINKVGIKKKKKIIKIIKNLINLTILVLYIFLN